MSSKKDKYSKKDHLYMRLALDLAKSRHGFTGNNPSVGCVIVKKDKILSIGRTGILGRPHAEYDAINFANHDLKDSIMYVTLEPCNHYGKTPPCTNLIIKKGIKKVFYSINDIDKKVKGKSFKILKSNNIIVKKGLLKNDLNIFYEPYLVNRKKKAPYVTGKIALSKNNLIYNEIKKRITDIYSDKLTHYLRYTNDSILISYKTLNIDNPKLNCRIKELNRSPRRVILDNNLDSKKNSFIIKSAKKNDTIFFYNKANKEKINFFKKKGIKLIKGKINKNYQFDLKSILRILYKNGCRNLLVEGGNELTKSFLHRKLFNKFYSFKSNKKLSKSVEFKEFNSFNLFSKNFKRKSKINIKFGKDTIYLYKK